MRFNSFFGKRALSPLVATVIIIGLVTAISVMVFAFGRSTVEVLQERSDRIAEESFSCAEAVVVVSSANQLSFSEIVLIIENVGTRDIDGLIIRLTGDEGTVGSRDVGLGVLEKRSYFVSFDPDRVGFPSRLEILPQINVNGRSVVCGKLTFTADTPQQVVEENVVLCGNGVVDSVWEECDSPDFGGVSCVSLGFSGGNLGCSSNYCAFITSGCSNDVGVCGDGVADPSEECDGGDLRGLDCPDFGFSGGRLGCRRADCTYNTVLCW